MKRIIFILATILGMGNMSGAVAQNDNDKMIPGVTVNHYELTKTILLLCTKRHKHHLRRIGEVIPGIEKAGTIGVRQPCSLQRLDGWSHTQVPS